IEYTEIHAPDLDQDEWLDEEFNVGDKIKINLADMDLISWEEDLKQDQEILGSLLQEMTKITPEDDQKLAVLKKIIDQKIENPINPGNKKIIIFSAFTDTVDYLYEHVSVYVKEKYRLETAKVVGGDENKNTAGLKNDFNTLLTCFSPKSKE